MLILQSRRYVCPAQNRHLVPVKQLVEILIVMRFEITIELSVHSLYEAAANYFVLCIDGSQILIGIFRTKSLMSHGNNLSIIHIISVALDKTWFAFYETQCLSELDIFFVNILAIIILVRRRRQSSAFPIILRSHCGSQIFRMALYYQVLLIGQIFLVLLRQASPD